MTHMKTLSGILIIAALAAFLLLPIGFEIAMSVLFAIGFAAVVGADYSRRPQMARVATAVAVASQSKERFGLAA